MQMATGYWVSQSLYAAAKLGIADLLKDGSKSCDELATATAVKARPLYRLLRGLASVGVFSETEPGYFTLTPLAACLQSDISDSMRAVVTILGEEEYRAWGDILYTLRTGGSAFEHVYKMPLYQHHAQKPDQGKMFNEAMMVLFPGACERTEVEYRSLFEACGFHLNKIYPTRAGTSVIEGIRV